MADIIDGKTVEDIIKVEGMHCHGCEALIKDILEDEKGIEYVSASHKRGIVSVRYDPGVIGLARITELINLQDGYRVILQGDDAGSGSNIDAASNRYSDPGPK